MSDSPSPQKQGTGMLSVFKSVLAAGFGVQNEANRVKDFQQGRAVHFIVAGLVATVIFMLIIWGLVQLALMSA